jgi:hypothetical protein
LGFELPEPYAVKASCTVLAGESGSNAADLLSYLKQWKTQQTKAVRSFLYRYPYILSFGVKKCF